MSNKRRAAKNLAIYSASTFIRQIVGFLMLPIYTRYLTPADYGVIALLSLMLYVFEATLGARFYTAVSKFYFDEDDEESRFMVISTALLITGAVSIFGFIVIILSSGQLSAFLFGDTKYSIYVAIYGTLLVTGAVSLYGVNFLRLLDKPVPFLIVSIVRLAVQLGLNIWFVVVLQWGVKGVVTATVISSVLFGILLGLYTIRHTGLKFDRILGREMLIFSWPLWFSGLAALYLSSANRYMIRFFGDLTEVGLFELAVKFAGLLSVVTWLPFSQWWNIEQFSIYKREANSRPIFATMFNLVSLLTVYACVGIILFSGPVIRIMAAPQFHESAQIVAPLVFGIAFSQLSLFLNFSFLVSRKTKLLASITWANAVFVTAVYLFLIPSFGYVGAAYGVLLSGIFTFTATFILSKRTNDIGVNLTPLLFLLPLGALFVFIDITFVPDTNILVSLAYKTVLVLVLLVIFLAIATTLESTRKVIRDILRFVSEKVLATSGKV